MTVGQMLRAFSTLGCPELELDAVLALARTYGLDGVELRALGGTVDLPAHLALRMGGPDAFAKRVADSGLRVLAFGTSVRLMAHTEADRETLLEYGRWAHAAGVPALRVFDGGTDANPAEIARAADLLDWWREVRRARDWTAELVIETHDALAHPDALERFVAAIPDAALLWDAHHTWRRGGEAPARTLERIRPLVRHIHVKDSVPDAAQALGCRYVLPGTGEFPMQVLLDSLRDDGLREDSLREDSLREDGQSRVLSLEWERMWHPSLPPMEAALDAARAHAWW